MKISLCMIVKDEERFIESCIESALSFVDEVIIVDTGSTDSTLQILHDKFKSKVNLYHHTWEKDFSKARNASIEYATGDWILILDGDEKVICDRNLLERHLSKCPSNSYFVPIYNFLGEKNIKYSDAMIRLFKNNNYRFKGNIHEQLYDGEQLLQGTSIIESSTISILHFGYLPDVMVSKGKNERNLSMIQAEIKKDPKNPFHYYNLGVMQMQTMNFIAAIESFIKASALTKGVKRLYHEDIVFRLMVCLLETKQFSKLGTFIKDLKTDAVIAEYPDYYYYMGLYYKGKNEEQKSIQSFETAIRMGDVSKRFSLLGSGSFISMMEIANLHYQNGRIQQAIEKYMEAVFHPKNYMKKGLEQFVYLLKENKMDNVLDELNLILQTQNRFAGLISDEKYVKIISKEDISRCIESGNIELALTYIKRYEEVNKGETLYSFSAVCNMLLGDFDSAKRILIEGLEQLPKDFDLLYNLAYLYESTGQNDLANSYYMKANKVATPEEADLIADKVL